MKTRLRQVACAALVTLLVLLLPYSASAKVPDSAGAGTARTESGDEFRWGISVSAIRFRASRSAARPGRERVLEPDIRGFSGQFGFQFSWLPPGDGWRLNLADGTALQLFSVGFMILGEVNADRLEQSDMSLAFILGFLNNTVGIGVGIDLYRGIGILGQGGPSAATAYTGVLSHLLVSEGEMTAENVVGVVFINIVGLVEAISGSGAPHE